MATITIDAGVCGFKTVIHAHSEDGQHVDLEFESACPHVMMAQEQLKRVDAFDELAKKLHETTVHQVLSKHLPHLACPLSTGVFKAIEVAAGLALPKDVIIRVEA